MPATKGAIRKLRADKRKAVTNSKVRKSYKAAVSLMRRKATPANLREAYRTLDRAAKIGVLHRNKAARLKSRLTTLVKKKKK